VEDQVALAIQQSADAVVVPRFQALAASEIQEKQPGDFVTIADQECEALLERALSSIAPGVPILGEEAASADPELAHRLLTSERLWVVDPVDGTRAFIDGSPDFSVMVAMIERGEATAGWIYHPMHRVMWAARRGLGTRCNGAIMRRRPTHRKTAELHGFIKTGFMDSKTWSTIESHRHGFAGTGPGPASAGFSYPSVVGEAADFVMFWRTLPWDHAPGVLIAQEAGCHVARLDGSDYRPQQIRSGLLAAADQTTWAQVRDVLLPEERQPTGSSSA